MKAGRLAPTTICYFCRWFYNVGTIFLIISPVLAMMKITAVQIDPPKLHKTIVAYFSLDELQALCFDLTLNFDELPPGGLSTRARGLVEMCQRQRRLVALAEAILVQRPHIPSNAFLRDIADDDAPFKGLLAFEEADEEIFFGREELTAELVARVMDAANFLALVGASGSGKSSVARAGMIPQLRRQTNWPIHLITPTAHPLQALATSLTRDSESVTATATLMDDLQQEPRALRLYAARMLQNSQTDRLLLVIDQFEELFTLCKDEAERTAFVENLVSAVAEDSQITILLTLRADFYAQCLKYEPLHRLLEQQQKIVPTMSSVELRAAIELPAQQANLNFDNGLVDILLRDVGAADNQTPEPGALPLLSHALLETWQRRDPAENRLTLAGYTEAGGVQGAIAKTAESTYQQLPADQQKIARSIFLRLTELGEGTQDTRRRAALAELLSQNEERAKVEQVLKTLADARLLTTSNDGAEVAHEALIRQWPTLQNWLGEDREGLRLHRQVTEAAQDWEGNEREESYLFRGGRLEQTNEWVARNDTRLNQLETEFLAASGMLEMGELSKAQAVAAERTRASRFLRTALFVADLFAIGFLVFLLQAQGNARILARQQQVALTQSTAALANVVLEQNNDTELATLLTIASARLNWNNNSSEDWLIDNNLRSYLGTQRFFNNSLFSERSPLLHDILEKYGKPDEVEGVNSDK
jgi:DNA replication protein DnaC